jgi:hypothetical protein
MIEHTALTVAITATVYWLALAGLAAAYRAGLHSQPARTQQESLAVIQTPGDLSEMNGLTDHGRK